MSSRRKKRRPRSNKQNPKQTPNEANQDYDKDEEIRINKFIAHAGLCSRRDADEYVEQGLVEVNGEVVTQHGTKVTRADEVKVDGQTLSLEPFVYILLNKPKDTITTTDDPRGRDTVMDKIEDATGKRVYPVGRLDRHTMGLLLLTNDGDLAHRLMHPSYQVRKTYEVETDRFLTDDELDEMVTGIQLADGEASAYRLSRLKGRNGILLSIMEGRNRLVRRMIEYFDAEVTKLKRVEYAGLTLKGVKMGRWRYLKQKEINGLRKLVKLDKLNFRKK
jgi:23S rRNA pseudouridine2605 synthase